MRKLELVTLALGTGHLSTATKDPRVYRDILKRTVGLRRRKVEVPDEALFDGVVVCGDKILEFWREAFRRVFAVDREKKSL